MFYKRFKLRIGVRLHKRHYLSRRLSPNFIFVGHGFFPFRWILKENYKNKKNIKSNPKKKRYQTKLRKTQTKN